MERLSEGASTMSMVYEMKLLQAHRAIVGMAVNKRWEETLTSRQQQLSSIEFGSRAIYAKSDPIQALVGMGKARRMNETIDLRERRSINDGD